MQEGAGNKYFWDTYAIIELLDGNVSFEKYSSENVIITVYNLAELYYSAINEYSLEEADKIFSKYKNAVVEIPDDVLKEAMRFRKEHKKKNLSYADCVGYIYAKEKGMKFLTGDREFSDFENVEFVK